MEYCETKNAPSAIGPYSQCLKAGSLVFTSGQIGMDPETGILREGLETQTEQACRNVCAILEAAGSSPEHVIKTTCFLQDMADFAAFNEIYARYFISRPARSCVAVRELPKGALCEIEAVAEICE